MEVKPMPREIKAEAIPDTLRICAEAEPITLDLTAQSADGKEKTPTFQGVGYTGGLLQLGWGAPVVIDLEGMKVPNQRMPALLSHDTSRIVGHTESVEITPKRLYVSGSLSKIGDAAAEVIGRGKEAFPWQMSVGANINAPPEFIPRGESAKANGRNFDGPVHVVRKSTLGEISFVAIGADMGTSATVSAAATTLELSAMNPEFLAWLKANEYTDAEAAALTGKKLSTLQAAWEASKSPVPKPVVTPATPANRGESLDAIIMAQRIENERVEAITRIVAESIQVCPSKIDYFEELGQAAIKANGRDGKPAMSAREFEITALRETRGSPFVVAGSASRDKPIGQKVIEAAMATHVGLPDAEKHFDAPTLEAAHSKFGGAGVSLLELIGMGARQNGWRGHSVKADLRSACRHAFAVRDHDVRASGPSTIDISTILSNTANKFLRIGFESVESAWRSIAAIRSVNDFKEITSFSLTGDLTYEQVAPGGQIKHGTLSETTYGNKADTFAKMLGLDRRDLINDDAGALNSAGRRLGRGGALKFNLVFWTEWLDDSAFFPTDASLANYDSGSDSLLDVTGLNNITSIFRAQTDPDGNPLGVRPRILLVPVPLEGAALTLMNSEKTNLVSTSVSIGDANIWRNRYRVVSSDYIAGSAAILKTWYLLADPNDLPAIEACFLNGVEMPIVESADMDFDRLGISLRGYHDFGVRKQEYRAGVKSKGDS